MKILSELGDKPGMGLLMILHKHFRSDKEAVIGALVLGFSATLNNLDKMIWQEPRPYFITDVKHLNCKDIEYGNPSGHSMISTACYLTCFLLLKKQGLIY